MSTMAVAVVNYNTRAHLRACLASAFEDCATRVVVADNGSTDGSIEMVTTEFPRAILLVDASNPGYGGAANAAVARCDTDYVLLLNSDTVLRRGALVALRAYLDGHPRAAVVGPRLVNTDGTLQRSMHQFPTPLVTFLDYSWVGWTLGLVPALRTVYVAADPHTRARRVAWVTGAALAIRKSAFDAVGGFDRSYFMYFEEVDLSYRLRRAGWETHFAPVTDVIHAGGASTSQQHGAMFAEQMRAALRFSDRHHSPAMARRTWWALHVALWNRLASDTMRLHLTRDGVRRERLADDIATVRGILRGPWRPAASQATTRGPRRA